MMDVIMKHKYKKREQRWCRTDYIAKFYATSHRSFFSFQGVQIPVWTHWDSWLPGKHDSCHIAKALFMYLFIYLPVIQIHCRKHFTVSLPHELNFQISDEKFIFHLPAYSSTQILSSVCLYFFFFAFPLLFITRNHLETWKTLYKIKL